MTTKRCDCPSTLFDTVDGTRTEITLPGFTAVLGEPIPDQRWCARHGWVEARR